MSYSRSIFVCILASLVLYSCRDNSVQEKVLPPYVSQAIAKPGPQVKDFVSSFNPKSASGAITALDYDSRCRILSGALLNLDVFDNIDGAPIKDLLPDFAGETISSICLPEVNRYSLVEPNFGGLAVNYILASFSSLASDDVFDLSHKVQRNVPKLLLLGTPVFGLVEDDVRDLCSGLGIDIPIVSVPEAAVGYAFNRQTSAPVIGIITEADSLCTAAYKADFSAMCTKLNLPSARCYVYAMDFSGSRDDLLRRFLDGFEASGISDPLNALIVDSAEADFTELNASLELIRTEKGFRNSGYARALAKNFELIDAMEVSAAQCYKVLRDRNVFTHNISYPKSEVFLLSDKDGVLVMEEPLTR